MKQKKRTSSQVIRFVYGSSSSTSASSSAGSDESEGRYLCIVGGDKKEDFRDEGGRGQAACAEGRLWLEDKKDEARSLDRRLGGTFHHCQYLASLLPSASATARRKKRNVLLDTNVDTQT